MTRVHHDSAAALSSRPSSRTSNRRKKPYKVVLESITQEKKKLRQQISYSDRPPPGYTFLPAGIPELSEFCKEQCRKRGAVVYVVSSTPSNKARADPEKLSHHIHRKGHHFPSNVVDLACDWLGFTFYNGTYQKKLDAAQNSRIARALKKHGNASNPKHKYTKTQISSAIRDLFPKIPEKDVQDIVDHAFREGTQRVGNATDLPLPRRVQLAVVAHIRHVYTDYDQLLRTESYLNARAKVEQACLDTLIKWRGEEKETTGAIELEDTFREFIIIDDSDDENDENDENDSDLDAGNNEKVLSIEDYEEALDTGTSLIRSTETNPAAENYPPYYDDYEPEHPRLHIPRDAIFAPRLHDNHPASHGEPRLVILQPLHGKNTNTVQRPYPVRHEIVPQVYANPPILVASRREREEPSVLYPVPAWPNSRVHPVTPVMNGPHGWSHYRPHDQPSQAQGTRRPIYPYAETSRQNVRHVNPQSLAPQDSPGPLLQRAPGRPERYVTVPGRESIPLSLNRPCELQRDFAPNDRDLVLPSIEGSENPQSLPALDNSRRIPSSQHVYECADHTTYGSYVDPRLNPQINREPQRIPDPNTRSRVRLLPAEQVAETTGVRHTLLPSPTRDDNYPQPVNSKRRRTEHYRSETDSRDHEASFVNPIEVIDLTSSPRTCRNDGSRHAGPDDVRHLPPIMRDLHIVDSIPKHDPANIQPHLHPRRDAQNAYGARHGNHYNNDQSQHSQTPPLLQSHTQPQEARHPIIREARLPYLIENTSIRPNNNAKMGDDSPPKKHRLVTGKISNQLDNRPTTNTYNGPSPCHRPVDLDDPHRASLLKPGMANGGARTNASIYDLY